jgi:hypothetical protein
MNIFGNIGGLLSLLIFFGSLIVVPITEFSKNFQLLDNLFQFEGTIPNDRNNRRRISPIKSLIFDKDLE